MGRSWTFLCCRSTWIVDRNQLRAGSEEQDAFGDSGRGHAGFPEAIGGEQLEFGPRLHDVDVALFAGEIELGIGGGSGSGEALVGRAQMLPVKAAAGFGVEAGEGAVVEATVKIVAHDERG